MYSFYGGKEGRTYNIVYRYSSISDMVTAFRQGGAYNTVNYGEYVIIDTSPYLSNIYNGCLYRRGFNYTESGITEPNINNPDFYDEITSGGVTTTQFNQQRFNEAVMGYKQNPGGGAQYVGQIVGPQGKVPKVELKDYSQVDTSAQGGWSDDYDATIPGYEYDNGSIFHDNVQVAYFNIIDENGEQEGCYLAFNFPYPVFDFEAASISPYGDTVQFERTAPAAEGQTTVTTATYSVGATYNDTSDVFSYDNLVYEHPQSGGTTHPFYHNYRISIPRGIHGKDIQEFKIATATSWTVTPDPQSEEEETSEITQTGFNINGQNVAVEDLIPGDQYLYYTKRDYNKTQNGEVSVPLGVWPFKTIVSATTDNTVERQSITWPESGTTSVTAGQLYTLISSQNKYALCIQGGQIETPSPASSLDIGQIYTSGTAKFLVTNVSSAAPATFMTIDYTAGESDVIPFHQIDYAYRETNGDFYVKYTDGLEPQFICKINSLDQISIENGQFIVNNSDGTNVVTTNFPTNFSAEVDETGKVDISYEYGNATTVASTHYIQQIDQIGLTKYTSDHPYILTATYNNYQNSSASSAVDFGNFDSIVDIKKVGDSIWTLHADKFNIISGATTHEDENGFVWHDLGGLDGQYHLYGIYDSVPSDPLPSPYDGWVIGVRENDNIVLYAYDLNSQTPAWVPIQTLDGTRFFDTTYNMIMDEKDPNSSYSLPMTEDYSKLNDNGLWFVQEESHHESHRNPPSGGGE